VAKDPSKDRGRRAVRRAVAELSGEYVQATAASVWTVNHNLGRYPSAKVLNTAGQELLCTIEHTSLNQLVVKHKTSIAGRVVW
jgi:hypothetical protein